MRCAAGDQSGLIALYDESSQLVYSVVVRMLGDVADAEEVTSDVYTQVWKTAAAYDTARGNVAAWLLTIARTRAIDRLRSRHARQRNEMPLPEGFDLPAAGVSPERETEEMQRRRLVLTALGKLPTDERRLIQLAFFSGLTHRELSTRLRQPLGTVKTRIRTGMMKLREQLGSAPA